MLVSHNEVPSAEEAERTANPAPATDTTEAEHDGPNSDVRYNYSHHVHMYAQCLLSTLCMQSDIHVYTLCTRIVFVTMYNLHDAICYTVLSSIIPAVCMLLVRSRYMYMCAICKVKRLSKCVSNDVRYLCTVFAIVSLTSQTLTLCSI